MSLMKWLRKNKQKILAVVVVIIMITFVGGYSLRQLIASQGPTRRPIATLGDDDITEIQRMEAIKELEILRDMGAAQVLMQHQGISGPLLSQLLFYDSATSSMLEAQIKYAAMQGEFVIDQRIVQDFFNANEGDSPIYWIILNKEALDLGVAVDTKKAMEVYRDLVIQMTQGQGQAAAVVQNISNQHKVPQRDIIEIFAKLLSVMGYVDNITRTQNVSLPEVQAAAGFSGESINSKYVEFRAENYTELIEEVDEDAKIEQFEAYKSYLAGDITEANPYGFGYKIADRVMLEYAVIKLDDVKAMIEKPTTEQMEQYYSRHRSEFTERVPSDPTDPDSEMTTRVKRYSEVMRDIENRIIEQRTGSRAEMIINDFRNIVGEELMGLDFERLSGEEIKQHAGDYQQAAETVSRRHDIAIYTGKTGFLSRDDLSTDRNLSRLSIQRPQRMPVDLATKVFAVEGLEVTRLSRFDGTAPKLYEDIGPMHGMHPQTIAVVRVVDFKKQHIPEDIDVAFDISKSAVGSPKTEQTFSIRENVVEDCKIKFAMDTALEKAEKFIEFAGDDWQAAKEKYNEESDYEIWISDLQDRQRVSELELIQARMQAGISPMGANRIRWTIRNKMMMNTLYSLKDAELPKAVKFPAGKSAMAVSNVEVNPPTTADYAEIKKIMAAQMEGMAAVKSAFIHLNVDNMLARANFKYVERDTGPMQE